jgi:hypothetical protein
MAVNFNFVDVRKYLREGRVPKQLTGLRWCQADVCESGGNLVLKIYILTHSYVQFGIQRTFYKKRLTKLTKIKFY